MRSVRSERILGLMDRAARVLCLGKQFCVGGVHLGRLVIKIVAFLCAEGFMVVLGVVGVMVRSGVVRGRCIVRYGVGYQDY